MSMGRYLCQLCWSIVHYGERHPCFFYKEDDEVYTVPPPCELDEMERKDEMLRGTHAGNLNDNKGNPFAVADQSYIEGSNETASLPFENNEQILLAPASRRKRSRLSLMPSKFLRVAKNEYSHSKWASSTHAERDGSKNAAKKSRNCRKTESTSAQVLRVGIDSTSEMATNSAAIGPVSDAAAVFVAGTSGVQAQPHRTGKILVCDVCGKAFARKDHLEVHSRTHTGDKPFVCNTCGKRFTQKSHLSLHLWTHTEDKPFVCDICGKGFAQKSTLTLHLWTHTEDKPFVCNICGKGFVQKGSLDSHLPTHLGEKHFKCKFCDECFARRSSCIRHQKRQHGGM